MDRHTAEAGNFFGPRIRGAPHHHAPIPTAAGPFSFPAPLPPRGPDFALTIPGIPASVPVARTASAVAAMTFEAWERRPSGG
jgi:hypothetical protein